MRLSLICIVDGVRSTFAASNSSTSCHVVFLLDMETASFLQWCSWLHQRLQTLLRWPQIPEDGVGELQGVLRQNVRKRGPSLRSCI